MEKFRNKYRRESTRVQNWNYGWSHPYFITVCTKDRIPFFGEIRDGRMHLSEIGTIVKSEWERTPRLRPDMNLVLGAFVVMPDHLHGIITIGRNGYNKPGRLDDGTDQPISGATPVSGEIPIPIEIPRDMKPQNRFGPQSKNLASIMRGFKSSITIQARVINPDFTWQSGFYDCIVNDSEALRRIEKYILENPSKWKDIK